MNQAQPMGCHRLCIAGFLGGALTGAAGLLVADGSVRSWTTRESHMKRSSLVLSAVLFTLIGCDGSEGSASSKSSENSAASEGSSSSDGSDKPPYICENRTATKNWTSDISYTFIDGYQWECYPNSIDNGGHGWRSRSFHKDGKLQGTVIHWYNNGQKMSQRNHRDGDLQGLGTVWYRNGQKKNEAEYRDGLRHGTETRWHENGTLKSQTEYRNGQKVRTQKARPQKAARKLCTYEGVMSISKDWTLVHTDEEFGKVTSVIFQVPQTVDYELKEIGCSPQPVNQIPGWTGKEQWGKRFARIDFCDLCNMDN